MHLHDGYDVLLSKALGHIITHCYPDVQHLKRVPTVLTWCTPLKVLKTIIRFVSVQMVGLWSLWIQAVKRHQNKPMHQMRGLYSIVEKCDLPITTTHQGADENPIVYTFIPNPSKIRNTVATL